MPEPFTQLSQARGMWQAKGVSCQVAGDKRLPREQPVLPPEMVVGSAGSAWAQPTVDIGFTGTAAMTLLLMHEMTAITALGLWPGPGGLGGSWPPWLRFSASMSGDQLLVLQTLHAAEAAWGTKAQRAAADDVPLGAGGIHEVRRVLRLSVIEVKVDHCERHPQSRSLEQLTLDAMEHAPRCSSGVVSCPERDVSP